jgi:hypothetical protein
MLTVLPERVQPIKRRNLIRADQDSPEQDKQALRADES